MNEQFEQDLADFKMRSLQAEIEMNSMISENKWLEQNGMNVKYRDDSFMNLIEKYRIYDNALPTYRGN